MSSVLPAATPLNQSTCKYSDSCSNAAAVTPSDTVQLTAVSERLYVGTTGNVTVITVGGQTTTYESVPAGVYIKVRARQVMATGTTASNIVAEW